MVLSFWGLKCCKASRYNLRARMTVQIIQNTNPKSLAIASLVSVFPNQHGIAAYCKSDEARAQKIIRWTRFLTVQPRGIASQGSDSNLKFKTQGQLRTHKFNSVSTTLCPSLALPHSYRLKVLHKYISLVQVQSVHGHCGNLQELQSQRKQGHLMITHQYCKIKFRSQLKTDK